MTERIESRPGLIATTALGVLIITGTAMAFGGLPVWPLVVGTAIAVVLTLGQAMSWASASVSTLSLLLIASVLLLRFTATTGADITLAVISSLTMAGLGSVALLAVRRENTRWPSRTTLNFAAFALPVPALTASLAALIALVSGGTRLSWGMNNDVATNMMHARYMWNNGGLNPDLNPNASPLMQTLIVAVSAPGRGELTSGELLAHDLERNAQLWIVVTLLASVIAGLLVVRVTRSRSTGARLCSGAIGAAIPLTWYVTATSLQFGFMNGPMVVALLCCLWVVWTGVPRAPMVSLGATALLTTVFLTSWAPLAILPLALGAFIVATKRFGLWSQSKPRERLWGIACGLQMALYIGFVTVPDFLVTSDGLANDGGMAPLTPATIVVSCSLVILIAVIGWSIWGHSNDLSGVIVLAAASTVATGYLVYQRRAADVLWGYYPAKFAWFVSILLIIVIVSLIVSWTPPPSRRGAPMALIGAAALTALGLLTQLPPTDQATIDIARATVDLRPGAPAGSVDEAVADLVSISDPTSRDLAVGLGPHDRFVNYWLIHMTAPEESDPIRLFGYFGDPNQLDQVCQAVETWGGNVTLHTRDSQLQDSLRAVCSADFTVSLKR